MEVLLQKLFFRLNALLSSRFHLWKPYYRTIGVAISRGVRISKVHLSWPHQVFIGEATIVEHDVYFHFDGVHKPGPSIVIGRSCFIGCCCEFNVRDRVQIGDRCLVAAGTRFVDHDHNITGTGRLPSDDGKTAPILLSNDVWIGANCVILKGVSIGSGAVVGASSVLTKNVPPNEIWAGVPAKQIGSRS
jgi:acetyltransferase-like isoleucine patch superfamily enzyme